MAHSPSSVFLYGTYIIFGNSPPAQQMTKAFLPQMKAKNHGHIVTVASALGLFSTACVEVRCSINDSLNHKLNELMHYRWYLNADHSAGVYFPPPGLLCQ